MKNIGLAFNRCPGMLNPSFVVKPAFIIAIVSLQFLCTLSSNATGINGEISYPDTSKGIAIHQEVNFKASPNKVYEALLSSKEFSACTSKSAGGFSKMSATIDARPGGTFSVFDGHIIGRILELVPNQRIVEAWRVVDWPAGTYSIARFELQPQGTGTRLVFDHTGFPEDLKAHLASGWEEHYWDALTKYFE